jgi:hypothetical protein
LSQDLKPLVEGVLENKKHWIELAKETPESIKNRKNSSTSLRTISSSNTEENYAGINNNSSTNNFNLMNGNGDEMSTSSTESSNLVSKIVGKFPLDTITATNSLFAGSTFIKPNGVYKAATSPISIIPFNTPWNEKNESNNNNQQEVLDQ